MNEVKVLTWDVRMSAARERLQDVMDTLSQTYVATVEHRQQGAMTYVWGWQDGRGEGKDTDVSIEFGTAYAIHVAEFLAERRHYCSNVQTAWNNWLEQGQVERSYLD